MHEELEEKGANSVSEDSIHAQEEKRDKLAYEVENLAKEVSLEQDKLTSTLLTLVRKRRSFNCQPVLVAQCFKCSRCIAPLSDVHALGAPLEPGERGLAAAQSPFILPEVSGYHTGGRDVEKTSFPPPSAHLSKLFRYKIVETKKLSVAARRCLGNALLQITPFNEYECITIFKILTFYRCLGRTGTPARCWS